MRRILFGTLLALLLSLVGCSNQRPERDVPLDTSTEPLFLGSTGTCGSDSVAGWTDCDPKTNRANPRDQDHHIEFAARILLAYAPAFRRLRPAYRRRNTLKHPWNSLISKLATLTKRTHRATLLPRSLKPFVPELWQSENMPAFRRQAPWERWTQWGGHRAAVVAGAAALQVGPDLGLSAPAGAAVPANCLFQAATAQA